MNFRCGSRLPGTAIAAVLAACLLAGYLSVRSSRRSIHKESAPPESAAALTSARGHVDYLSRTPRASPRPSRLTPLRRRARTHVASSDLPVQRDAVVSPLIEVDPLEVEAPAVVQSTTESLQSPSVAILESARTVNWQELATNADRAARMIGPVSPHNRGVPKAMTTMYVTFGLLQALDVHSTRVALQAGAREANPMMAGVAGNPVAFIGIKAASAAGTTYLIERLRKRHPAAAAITMAALDTTYTLVVMHNARAANRVARGR